MEVLRARTGGTPVADVDRVSAVARPFAMQRMRRYAYGGEDSRPSFWSARTTGLTGAMGVWKRVSASCLSAAGWRAADGIAAAWGRRAGCRQSTPFCWCSFARAVSEPECFIRRAGDSGWVWACYSVGPLMESHGNRQKRNRRPGDWVHSHGARCRRAAPAPRHRRSVACCADLARDSRGRTSGDATASLATRASGLWPLSTMLELALLPRRACRVGAAGRFPAVGKPSPDEFDPQGQPFGLREFPT